jgi:hypothetical protein
MPVNVTRPCKLDRRATPEKVRALPAGSMIFCRVFAEWKGHIQHLERHDRFSFKFAQ